MHVSMVLSRSLSQWVSLSIIIIFSIISLTHSAYIPPAANWTDTDLKSYVESRASTSGSMLRILCLGASITFGVGSTTGNGYRDDLRNQLVAAGHSVHFVGTQTSGSMVNNANEGYPGFRIDQVTDVSKPSYGYLPNIVLIHLGTNDMNQRDPPSVAASRMGALIDQVFAAVPNTMIVVSKLLPNKNPTTEAGIEGLNSLLEGVVSPRIQQGDNIILVDMHSGFSVADLGPDGTHPLDEGYFKMAGVWFDAVNGAMQSQRVSNVLETGLSDTNNANNNKCAFTPSMIPSPTAEGFGYGNKSATFKGAWDPKGVILTDSSMHGTNVFWGDLDGNGLDDFIHLHTDGTMKVAFNGPAETFGSFKSFTPPACDISGVHFIDMNGDGVDDFVCIDSNGGLTAWYTATGGTPSWGSVSLTRATAGYGQQNVHVTDIDGDGAGDYVYVDDGGVVGVSYNLGYLGVSWTDFSTVFTIPSYPHGEVQFMDVNSDGRADIVIVEDSSQMDAYMNYRGNSILEPDFWYSGTILHPIGYGILSNNMTFGRIRGSAKTDLATVHGDGTVKLYENRGYEGIAYGEYCRFCDMLGIGSDSYVSLGPSGSLKLFVNLHNGGFHLKFNEILGDQGLARADLHLADIDGDGRCDYVIVNNRTGGLRYRRNEGVQNSAAGSTLSLSGDVDMGVPTSCDSAGVRFADLNGDGKADYICISANGQVTVAINTGQNSFGNTASVFSASADFGMFNSRDPMSFADINGDGNADYLFFDHNSGSISVMLNTGNGLSFGAEQSLYSHPTLVNGWVKFANLGGFGRADIVNIVSPLSAKAKSFANRCTNPKPPALPERSTFPPGFKCTAGSCQTEPPTQSGWQNVSCSYGSLTDDTSNGTQQWIDAQVSEAWNDAISAWKTAGTTDQDFVDFLGNEIFHTKPNFNCDVIMDTNCDGTINCGQGNSPNAAVDAPAGYLIFNSFIGIHIGFDAFYSALQGAQGNMQTRISAFSNTFSPTWTESQAEKIILDIIALGFALVAAPTWNSWLKSSPVFKNNGNTLGTIKDSVNPIISNSITIIKDSETSGPTPFSQMATVDTFLGVVISQWINTLSTQLSTMFDGSDDSNQFLYSLIEDCQTFLTENTTSVTTLQPIVETALWAQMVPFAWRNSAKTATTPVILNSTGVPRDSGATGCDGWHPENIEPIVMKAGTGTQGFVCGAETNYEPYWIVSAYKPPNGEKLNNVGFSSLPGISKLGGAGSVGDWGGLTRDDLVITAVNSWIANGHQNGWNTSVTDATITNIVGNGLHQSGIVNIPVCGWKDVYYGYHDSPASTFPCLAYDGAGKPIHGGQ